MNNIFKLTAASLALVITPAIASADSVAVSLSATFTGGSDSIADLDAGNDGMINTVDVAEVTSLSIAGATGANAAASTAGVTINDAGDTTFANAGGGSVSSSEQALSFQSDDYTATVSFGEDDPV